MEDFMVTVEGLELVSRESRIEIVLLKKSLEVQQLSIYTYTSILPPPLPVSHALPEIHLHPIYIPVYPCVVLHSTFC
jgi:hypothetical protein